MKKILCFITVLLMTAVLFGCNNASQSQSSNTTDKPNSAQTEATDATAVNELNDVTVKTEKSSYPGNVEKIKVIFNNKSDIEYNYGESFTLEKKIDGKWTNVPFKNGYTFNSVAYVLKPNGTREIEYPINQLTGDLESGDYRILTDVQKDNTNSYNSYLMTAEFTIK